MEPMSKKKGKPRKPPQTRANRSTQRPLSPRPQQAPTSASTPGRSALERRSASALLFLHRLPRWLLPVVVGVLLLLGLAIPHAWAGIFLLLIAGLFGWLLALSWPVITVNSRIFRGIVVAVVAIGGVARMAGWT